MKSEFQKKMDLLDPNYVVPQSERVSNRKSFAIKTEPIQKNEAGLEILPDQPISQAMQDLYMRRMMDTEALEALIENPESSNVYDQAVLMEEIAKKRGK